MLSLIVRTHAYSVSTARSHTHFRSHYLSCPCPISLSLSFAGSVDVINNNNQLIKVHSHTYLRPSATPRQSKSWTDRDDDEAHRGLAEGWICMTDLALPCFARAQSLARSLARSLASETQASLWKLRQTTMSKSIPSRESSSSPSDRGSTGSFIGVYHSTMSRARHDALLARDGE